MTDKRDVWILDSPKQAVRHLCRALVEMRVHTRDDDFHLLEHRVRKVESAISENVHFNAGENLDFSNPLICLPNALDVFDSPLVIQAVRKSKIF